MQAQYFVQILMLLAGATVLACWCGWALARLALPSSLASYRSLLAPLLGYALALVVGYWGVRTIFGLRAVLALLVVGAGMLNLLAWQRGGPPRPVAAARAHWPLLLLLLAALLVGVAPLLRYGHPAIIGAGWDTENYLPTARYLERGPITAIASAAPNPLRDINAFPPKIGLTLGFSIWQGYVDLLAGTEALVSFAPLLAWLRMLGVLASYVLFRATLGLGRGPALLGVAWVAAGTLLLWVGYFNFGMQLAAWPLIPLGLTMGVAVVAELAAEPQSLSAATPFPQNHEPITKSRPQPRLCRFSVLGSRFSRADLRHDNRPRGYLRSVARSPRSIALASAGAVALAALPITYYPALTLWGPLAAGLGLALLLDAPSARMRMGLLVAAAALLGLTLAIAALTVVDYTQGFSYRYSNQLTTLGLFRYIPLTDIVGVTQFDHQADDTPPASPAAQAGLAALLGLVLAGLLAHPQQLRLAGLFAGALIYLGWLRWWQAYPYAYMKGAAYAAFALLAAAAAGWQALAARLPQRWRVPASVLPLLLLGLMGTHQLALVQSYARRPGLYAGELPALLDLRSLVPPGSSVTFSSNPRSQRLAAGLAAYMLDHTTVWGAVRTGYAASAHGTPDAVGEYGLLPATDDPAPFGYGRPLWYGGPYALYQRPLDLLANLRLTRSLAPGDQLAVAVGDHGLALGQADLPGGQARLVELQLAALYPGELTVNGRAYALPPGNLRLRLADVRTPATLVVQNTGAAPLTLRTVALHLPACSVVGSQQTADDQSPAACRPPSAARYEFLEGSARAVVALSSSAVVQARADAQGAQIATTLDLLATSGPLTVALDIWDTASGRHYGWYGLLAQPGPAVQRFTLTLDPTSGAMQASTAEGAPIPLGASFEGLHSGEYSARLLLAAGTRVLLDAGEVFTFKISADGRSEALQPGATPLLATTLDRMQQPLAVQLGDDVRLRGYTLEASSARSGQELGLTLWWEALAAPGDERSILVQLRDAQGRELLHADGAPTGGSRPTSAWQPGDLVIDARQLRLPAGLPPGEYDLLIGMYRWPSLERLALLRDGARQPEDMLRIPILVSP